ncbi:MAG TPA: MOSC domain-containing protein [Actinomycetota bacterium]|nr:MOSC domain-containing protein [Actinomycetota bacterium]
MARVARFNVTPVKSTSLHHPDRLRFDARGAIGDRRFFFVDGDGKRFSGATKAPILPVVSAYDEDRDHLELRLPDGVVVSGRPEADGEALLVDFYGRRVSARVVDGDFTEALSRYAGHEVRLARPDRPGDALDVRPVTLVSLESVAELAEHGGHDGTLDPGRFRMTIEIEGVSRPHEEDSWAGREVRVGEVLLRVGTPVPRCVVTTLDPATGKRDFPTLRVIRDYRGLNAERELEFGVYAEVVRPGEARVGDPVEPIE